MARRCRASSMAVRDALGVARNSVEFAPCCITCSGLLFSARPSYWLRCRESQAEMSYECILFDVRNVVARLTLNRPQRLNSFNMTMHLEMREALQKAVEQRARVLMLTGAGRAFCAGQDLSDRAGPNESARRHAARLRRCMESVSRLPIGPGARSPKGTWKLRRVR